MPCVNRRGCAERFSRLPQDQLLTIIWNHGSCGGCGDDVTDDPRFADGRPYCPACFEQRWPSGAPGPFEQGKPQVYR